MFIKLMSCDDAPDHDTRKRYRLLADVVAVDFQRVATGTEDGGSYPRALVTFGDGKSESFFMEGNAYVMNDAGLTISSFGHAYIPGTPCAPVAEQGNKGEIGTYPVKERGGE